MDMSQYIDIFLEESQQHLKKLNSDLLELESATDKRYILDDIFRSAHTLKGMSATMGFTKVTELTHEMENILHGLRNNDIKLTSEIVEILFNCVDALDAIINDIAKGGYEDYSIDGILGVIRTAWQSETKENINEKHEGEKDNLSEIIINFDLNEFEKDIIKEAVEHGLDCYYILVCLNSECVLKAARAFMVLKSIEKVGEIIKVKPTMQLIEEEKFDKSFEVIIISGESAVNIRKAFDSLTEIEEPDIIKISEHFSRRDFENHKGNGNFVKLTERLETVQKETHLKPSFTQIVRVDKTKLDTVMNLVGELVINKTRLEQIGRFSQIPELTETIEQMDRITSDLQNVVMKVRMVPLDSVFSRFPRMVRDLAKELGKEITLFIEGKETELDRTVIDEIGDPLVHLLRNCVDHGIEEPNYRIEHGKTEHGKVLLTARHEGNHVIIEVEDDGRGMDYQAIKSSVIEKGLASEEEVKDLNEEAALRLIMLPGFSTAPKVTDISGRGVGLDAVKNKIEALNGVITIKSSPGMGTKFKIKLPLTLAIIKALLVSLGSETYAVPLSSIAETTSVMLEDIKKMQGQEFMLLRGELLELVRLDQVLQVPDHPNTLPNEIDIVVVKKGEKRLGLIVDGLIGQREIVIKPLSKIVGDNGLFAGATILGDGNVSLIIDVAGLF